LSTPRRHHYVPQTHLAAFTDSGRKDGRLHVLDKKSGRSWPSNPGDAGCERDFYMLEVVEDGQQDALAVETFFGRLEGGYCEAIAATLDGGAVPVDGELRAKLMGFLAAQAMRVPGVLESWDRGIDGLMKKVAWYLTATPETWEAHVDRMREAGDPLPGVSYEQIRESVLSEDYTVPLDQNTRLGALLQPLPKLAASLDERHWTLVRAEDDAPDFVSSDRPLTVCWTEPTEARWPPPALGLARTTAMFPVGRRVALLGMFEEPFPMRVANTMLVGIVNMWTGLFATRFVYSAEDDLHVTLRDGTAGGREEFLRHVRGTTSA